MHQSPEQHHLTSPKGADTVGVVTTDDTLIKWTSGLRDRLAKNKPLTRQPRRTTTSLYRPFNTQHIDLTDGLIHRPAIARRYFPTPRHENFGFWLVGSGSAVPFTAIASRIVPDLHVAGAGSGGNYFPRYRWEPLPEGELDLGFDGDMVDGYRRVDNITEEIHRLMQDRYGSEVTKDDIFFFVYGLLHSPGYRDRYAGELKQMLPRIPNIPAESVAAFTSAGRDLFALHADYEDAEPYPLTVKGGEQPPMGGEAEYHRIEKIRFPSGKKAADAPDTLILNLNLTVTGIPEEAYRYQLGSRSAIEWIIRQYQVTTDKASGIVNDPNLWGLEHGNPRYILDLLQKVITVSVRTVEITESLPALDGEGTAS